MKRLSATISTIIFMFVTSTASTAFAEEVKISVGAALIKRVFDPVRVHFKEKSGIDIRVVFNDPVISIGELEKGNVDAAGGGLPLDVMLEQAGKAGIPVQQISAYSSFVPATETSMIVVNESNRVKTLSKEQLKGIFTGKTQNWKEVGGDDAPILVVWPSVSSGALIITKASIMDNEPLTKTVYDVPSIADTPAAVAATPESIGIVTAIKHGNGIREIATPIERPLTLVYKGKPSPNLQKLLDFLKGEGKKYIK